MVLALASHTLEGPYFYLSDLKDECGVYVIADKREEGVWYPLDVDESETVRASVNEHARYQCWQEHCQGTLGYAVLYLSGSSTDERRARTVTIRQCCGPLPCGR